MALDETQQDTPLRLSVDIVAAYLSNNPAGMEVIPDLIRNVHDAVRRLGEAEPQPQEAEKRKPAVPISRSVHHDYIVCLEDGKQLKMLKRYLRARYDMSPDDYRRKWNLPADYPMVAPAYAERRSQFARDIGLGKGVRRKKGR